MTTTISLSVYAEIDAWYGSQHRQSEARELNVQEGLSFVILLSSQPYAEHSRIVKLGNLSCFRDSAFSLPKGIWSV